MQPQRRRAHRLAGQRRADRRVVEPHAALAHAQARREVLPQLPARPRPGVSACRRGHRVVAGRRERAGAGRGAAARGRRAGRPHLAVAHLRRAARGHRAVRRDDAAEAGLQRARARAGVDDDVRRQAGVHRVRESREVAVPQQALRPFRVIHPVRAAARDVRAVDAHEAAPGHLDRLARARVHRHARAHDRDLGSAVLHRDAAVEGRAVAQHLQHARAGHAVNVHTLVVACVVHGDRDVVHQPLAVDLVERLLKRAHRLAILRLEPCVRVVRIDRDLLRPVICRRHVGRGHRLRTHAVRADVQLVLAIDIDLEAVLGQHGLREVVEVRLTHLAADLIRLLRHRRLHRLHLAAELVERGLRHLALDLPGLHRERRLCLAHPIAKRVEIGSARLERNRLRRLLDLRAEIGDIARQLVQHRRVRTRVNDRAEGIGEIITVQVAQHILELLVQLPQIADYLAHLPADVLVPAVHAGQRNRIQRHMATTSCL